MAAVQHLGNFASLSALQSAFAASSVPTGTLAYTTDSGVVVSNGGVWVPQIATGAQGSVAANFSLTSSAPTDWINSTSGPFNATPAPGIGNFTLRRGGAGGDLLVPLPVENLFQQSQTLSNAYWTKTNLTSVTDNAATDPLGGSTASAIVLAASGGPTLQLTSAPLTAAQQYTMSVWVQGMGSSIGATVSIGNFNNGPFQYSSINLTSGWQLVTVTFSPAGTTNNNLFLQLAGTTNTGHYANVPFNATVNTWGWQLNKGPYKKGYAVTTSSTVTDATNYQVLGVNTTSAANPIVDFVEESNGVFVGTPRTNTLPGADSSFLLIRSTARRTASIVIAAADSLNPYASDYICTGSADQTAISNAIFALRGKGGTVLLRAGTYGLSDTITHDCDWCTLEGESRGFWGDYNAQYPTISIEGWTGGVKLKQLVSGKAAITVGTNYQEANNRHQGIGIKKLYLFGYQLTGTGLVDTANTDISEITDCVLHNWSKGINVAWDTPFISGNSIQSCASDAVTVSGFYGSLIKNICYDIGGSGFVISSSGTQAVGNTVGHTAASAFLVSGKSNTISANAVQGVSAGSCVELNGATNCTVVGNALSLNRNLASGETNSNTTGHGVYLHATAVNNTISGNSINNTNASSTGYAVCLGQAGDTTITGCCVVGNNISGSKWNSAGTITILDSSTNSGNQIAANQGDSRGGYTYNAPTTGFAITIANGVARLILDPAGTLATGTVTMPSTPADGQEVGISSTQIITALTISGNSGQTIADTVSTLAVGGAVTFKWVSGQSKWYRVGN